MAETEDNRKITGSEAEYCPTAVALLIQEDRRLRDTIRGLLSALRELEQNMAGNPFVDPWYRERFLHVVRAAIAKAENPDA